MSTATKTTTVKKTEKKVAKTAEPVAPATVSVEKKPRKKVESKVDSPPEKPSEKPKKVSKEEGKNVDVVAQAVENTVQNVKELIETTERLDSTKITKGRKKKLYAKILRDITKMHESVEKTISEQTDAKVSRTLKTYEKELRNLISLLQLIEPTEAKRENSGFQKLVSISPEMADFAGWKRDELHSRNEVTKFLCDYISKNNLKNQENKRLINVDAPLKSLLQYDQTRDGDLTYARMQKLLKPHFVRA